MTAREIVDALEALGVRLRVAANMNDVDVEAEAEPPRELLDELVRNKVGVLSYLRVEPGRRWTDAEKARTFGDGRPEDDYGPHSAWGTF
jgi:hypothetical protein